MHAPAPIVIRPSPPIRFIDFKELWRSRELLYLLTWREVAVRYKQTAIGVAWALLQPLLMMLVFTLLFGRLAKIPSQGVPYPLFVYAGLLPWQLFARTVAESSSSLVVDQRLITRVYFPRMIIPLATTLAATVDAAVASTLLVALMLFYGVMPGVEVIWLPAFLLLMLATAVGVGLWLSALNVEFRDVTYVVPFLTQLWFFVTPVVYPSNLVPEQWRWLLALNPMAGVVEGFRWAILGVGDGPTGALLTSIGMAVLMLITGIVWFRNRERSFVDVLGSGGA